MGSKEYNDMTFVAFLIIVSILVGIISFIYLIMFGFVNNEGNLRGLFSLIICISSFTLFKYLDTKFDDLEKAWYRSVRKRNK